MTVKEYAAQNGLAVKTIYARSYSLVKAGELPEVWRDDAGQILPAAVEVFDRIWPDGAGGGRSATGRELDRMRAALQQSNTALQTAMDKAAQAMAEKQKIQIEKQSLMDKIEGLQGVSAIQAARIADLQGELDRVHDTLDKAVVAMLPGNRPSLFERLFKRREKQ